jgi:hypothetical protein
MDTLEYRAGLSVYRDVDVVVAGAGPAGIAAAVCAARNKAKVFVFDQWGCVGGMATMGLVGPFMTSFDSSGTNQIIRGVFEELVQRMKAMGGAIHPKDIGPECSYSGYYKMGHNHVGPFDHEAFKIAAVDMLQESGAELLLHTCFVDVMMEKDHIKGVVISNKAGVSALKAKVVIDCTGDGDVAVRAGEDYDLGQKDNGNIQAATLFFRVCNVDTEKMDAHMAEHAGEIRPFFGPYSWLIREKSGEWEGINRAEVCLFQNPVRGEFRMNVTRILDVDGTKPEDLTRAEIEGTKQAVKAFGFLKKHAPGFENAFFMGTAATIGIRETRHIHGKYWLTGGEVESCCVPDTSIAVFATNMDSHNKDNAEGTFVTIKKGPFYGVPYGCLLPKKTDNLLLAGRHISAESIAASSTRMIPCCMALGQAAGTAAALAVRQGRSPAEMETGELRKLLKEQGACFGA